VGRLRSAYPHSNRRGTVDGLVIVDLRETDPQVLERYMGKEGCADFRRFHNMSKCGADTPVRDPVRDQGI
jgi:hypothetical protein